APLEARRAQGHEEMKKLALLIGLALLGCAGGREPGPRIDTTPVPAPGFQGTTETVSPGSKRALIFTWRDRFPREIAAVGTTWFMGFAPYERTDAMANRWTVPWCASDGPKLIMIAEEHVS